MDILDLDLDPAPRRSRDLFRQILPYSFYYNCYTYQNLISDMCNNCNKRRFLAKEKKNTTILTTVGAGCVRDFVSNRTLNTHRWIRGRIEVRHMESFITHRTHVVSR